MTAQDVEQLVLTAIGDQWDRPTSHDLDLRRCVLRPPRLKTYIAHTAEGDVPFELWLVAEESPDTHDGYEVFYDANEEIFGLGYPGSSKTPSYIGAYGDLWDALEAM
jgi:hypothetical protein